MLDGIRLAHPALYAGWLALSAYLGVYLPVFIGLTRVAVHRLNLSLIFVAPIVWVGLELLRGHPLDDEHDGDNGQQPEDPVVTQLVEDCVHDPRHCTRRAPRMR